MPLDRTDFDGITESDLRELIEAQVPENLRLDYKLTAYGKSDADKKELLKDVSAFANSNGGHLVLGLNEIEGVPTALPGIGDVDSDAEITRIEQIVRGGLEPKIPGFRVRAVALSSGGSAIILRVPKSWNPPHRVVFQNTNRFYVRNSAGIHEPSVEELRTLFMQSTSALEHARKFRDQRIQSICSGQDGGRPLVGDGRLFLHIFPIAALSGAIALDVEAIHSQHQIFRPLGSTGNPRFNYHGFINERGGPENHGYTQIFRNGILEATKAKIVTTNEGRRDIHAIHFERYIFEVFSPYVRGLRDLGVPPPLIVMLTLEGVQGAIYSVGKDEWEYHSEPLLPDGILKLPECVLEDYGTDADHHRATRPAFDALWNASGYARAEFFDQNGIWNGTRHR